MNTLSIAVALVVFGTWKTGRIILGAYLFGMVSLGELVAQGLLIEQIGGVPDGGVGCELSCGRSVVRRSRLLRALRSKCGFLINVSETNRSVKRV